MLDLIGEEQPDGNNRRTGRNPPDGKTGGRCSVSALRIGVIVGWWK